MDGLAAVPQQGPETGSKRGPKTEEEKIAEAREVVRLAVAELEVAVAKAQKFDVPGWDLGLYLRAKIDPVLAKVGATTKALPKSRRV